MALRKFKKDPAPIIPILEKLRNDPSEYVRKSVANNLNDISKDHPDIVLNLCEQWKGQSKETDRIIKHACRTMLKDGNVRALMIFGFANPGSTSCFQSVCRQTKAKDWRAPCFFICTFQQLRKPQTVRLEYRIHYVKANRKTSPKYSRSAKGNFLRANTNRKTSFYEFHHADPFPRRAPAGNCGEWPNKS